MPATATHTLGREERIKSRRLIETLFNGGHSRSTTAFPLRLVYVRIPRQEGLVPHAMMVSVSKRRLHRAVDRNRQKRQIRESYRLNKSELIEFCEQNGLRVYIAFVSLAEEPCSSERIERSMVKLLRKTIEKLG